MNPSASFRVKKWKILGKEGKGKNVIDKIVKILFGNRGLKTKKDIQEFLNPPNPSTLNPISLGIKKDQLSKAVKRIKKAIKNEEQIIVYGDYDVDGICGSAILWETLNNLGAKVMPYIPHRIEEGYGLSIKGIENITKRYTLDAKRSLIISVDNGIVANEAVEFANKNGIDIIITDHHLTGKKLPKAHAIVHTAKLCGAGVAWVLAQQLTTNDQQLTTHLELVALATIADLVPLIGANRTLTKYGLEKLRKTTRTGLIELLKEAGVEPLTIRTYEVGHIIAPRLNAMGRIEHAMDSLRLLCTRNVGRAKELAQKLGMTNRERQQLTEETVEHAKLEVSRQRRASPKEGSQKLEVGKLLFIAHESYQQGVIGLVAGKLVDEFYRPAIVVSKGEKYSKASARSIKGFNIIEFIRSAQELLVDAGGHPMAAGFTVETKYLELLKKRLSKKIEDELSEEKLKRAFRIDCEIEFSDITRELYKKLQEFAPFGMGNPEPTFASRGVTIEDMWLVGNDGKHLKLRLGIFDAIAFGMGERAGEFRAGDKVDVVYMIDEDTWLARRSFSESGNRNSKLQLKIKDIKRAT